ncbi:MAG: cytochrome c oxidase assembly factor Coa1 family protein [Arenicellales bacterium]
MNNTSGQGRESVVPEEIRGWNWGAFLLNWIWGIGNRTYVALLALIPLVNLVMPFVLGAKGNEWAWRNQYWDSIDHFKRVQRKWGYASLAVYGGFLLLGLTTFVVVYLAFMHSTAYELAVTRIKASEAAGVLGSHFDTGFPRGSISSSGPTGKAELMIPVKGDSASGKAYVKEKKQLGKWTIQKLYIDFDGSTRRLYLVPSRKELIVLIDKARTSREYADLVPILTDRAKSGESLSQGILGAIYLVGGKDLEMDEPRAKHWLTLAAKQDNAEAEYNLGSMYYNGWGGPRDYVEAAKWYERAAFNHNSGVSSNGDAQLQLGVIDYNGEGKAPDKVSAFAWFSLAADHSIANAAKYRDTVRAELGPVDVERGVRLYKERSKQTRSK